MDDGAVSGEIARLEERIETLTASVERCRKISYAAKFAIAGGAAWFGLLLLWIVPFGPTAFVAAVSAVLGGCVLLGSNATTWDETAQALQATEKLRADLIGGIELRLVHDAPPTLH